MSLLEDTAIWYLNSLTEDLTDKEKKKMHSRPYDEITDKAKEELRAKALSLFRFLAERGVVVKDENQENCIILRQ